MNETKSSTNRFKQPLIYLAILLFGLILGSFFFWAANRWILKPISSSNSSPSLEPTNSSSSTPEPTPANYQLHKEVSVYLPYWDHQNGYETLEAQADKIKTVHPFWYQMKSNGAVKKFANAENETILKLARFHQMEIIPVISNEHRAKPVQRMFKSKTATAKHIANIVNLVKTNNYDGIEIDYESLEAKDKKNFSRFMRNLSKKLKAENKVLTAAVHAKTSNKGTWGGPAAQDWTVLNKACSRIKIMTYDYHWSTSTAGDIAPLSWMKKVIKYGKKKINPKKIHLGIHFYGYDWVGSKATGLTYSSVQDILDQYPDIKVKTSLEDEKFFKYRKKNKNHTVYFADAYVVKKRIALVNQYNLAGIGIWRIGKEDPNNWVRIGEAFSPQE